MNLAPLLPSPPSAIAALLAALTLLPADKSWAFAVDRAHNSVTTLRVQGISAQLLAAHTGELNPRLTIFD